MALWQQATSGALAALFRGAFLHRRVRAALRGPHRAAPTPRGPPSGGRNILFITSEDDRLVLPEESEQLYAHAKEPKKLVVLKGYGHYEVYSEPAFSEVMAATLEWYGEYL